MTDVAHLTIFQKTLLANFHVEGHGSDDPDHLPLALAGARQDAVYAPLLSQLGEDCPDVDTASAAITAAADKVREEAEAIRPGSGNDPQDRWGELCLVMGRLRQAAADVWQADSDRRMSAWK